MPMPSIRAVSLALAVLAAPMVSAEQAAAPAGDVERGKKVYRSSGCTNCHGWAADGRTGISLRYPPGSNLRESELDREGLIEAIRCGRPGTPMPFHDRAAYRDDRCFGLVMSDFEDQESEPIRGKTFREEDIVNIVAYLQSHVLGRGKPTFEECAEFFDNPDAGACRIIK